MTFFRIHTKRRPTTVDVIYELSLFLSWKKVLQRVKGSMWDAMKIYYVKIDVKIRQIIYAREQ